jgi:PAS domain S-box-containing protein
MNLYVALQLASCVAAAAIASAIAARQSGQRAGRLVAAVLFCAAHWSLCETLWNLSDDPDVVVWLIRASALGWLWMGPLSLDIYLEILGDSRSRLHRLRPFAYATAAVSIVLYQTPWCIGEPVRTAWGWGIRFGPLFPVAYLSTVSYVSIVLVQWTRFFRREVSPGERRLAVWMFVGIALPMAVASATDVILPLLAIHVPRLGSASLLMLGCAVAWSIRRYGYFLLAPGAFAREILETLPDGVALLDDEGQIRACNRGLTRLVGREPGELRGTLISDLLPDLPPMASSAVQDLEAELAPRTGERIPISASVSPLRSEKGDAIGQVVAIRDLREIVALRSRVVTSGRLAAVGELSAGIAHEINNPITFVRSNLSQLCQQWQVLMAEAEKSIPDPSLESIFSEGEELIEESVEGVDRVAAIVREVSAFSRAGLGAPEQADLNELLENAVNVAALRYPVTIECCYGELPPLCCTPQHLKQVLLHLLLNAAQAVGESGRVRIATQAIGDDVVIRVEDDGCGIPEDVLERIFDPFFTTRPAGEGTGLGLALGYQIVRNHGGEIFVDSEPGRGTTFQIRLPASRGEQDTAPI